MFHFFLLYSTACQLPPRVDHFGLKGVLAQPSVGSTRIPAIVFCVYQLMFAAITYVIALSFPQPHKFMSPLAPLLPWVRSQNGVNLVLCSSSSSCGRPSFTTLSPAGLGIPMDGHSSWEVSILLVVPRFISLPEQPPSRSLSTSESDADMGRSGSRINPIIRHTSSWVPFFCGSGGSDSTAVPLYLPISGLHKLVS